MTPSWWYAPEVAWMWQVILHSTVATAAFALWSRRLRMPSGRSRRLMLVVVLTLPLLTAAVPGRGGDGFREGAAWLDSSRLLSLPLPALDLHLWQVILAVAAVAVLAGIWQELAPVLHHHPRGTGPAPPELVERARALPGWGRVRVRVAPGDGDVALATSGLPGRPRLSLSRGALERLSPLELEAVLRHEHAHWRRGRWWLTHALFVVRLVQLFNPVALWSFREYLVETEIVCDRDAVAPAPGDPEGGRPELRRALGRALLRVYADTDHRDVATRQLLRRRVDALRGRVAVADDHPGDAAVAWAAILLAGVLPWIV